MADAFVSALFSTILENLNSLSMEGMGLVGGFRTKVEKLDSTLTTIQAVLQDAEEKQWKSEAIKNWLGKLKQVAYSLEDVLEDLKTEAIRRRMRKDVRSQVSTFFSPQNPLLFRLNMVRQFKKIKEKLDAIAEERTKFHLKEGVVEVEIQHREPTSSQVTESEIYGRENEKENIINMLLNNLSDHEDPSVFAICGMGGLGKTTMAQLVYNDENVIQAFDLRVWVCVSDDFDIKRLTKAILESIEGKPCEIQELDPLQRRLEEKLVGKRFLLVLDDLWNEYRDKWNGLKEALRCGVKGCTLIVTTRSEKVAQMMASVSIYRLGCLSDDDSWSLFQQRAFGMVSEEDKGNLEQIGREIVKKCGGVPLAINAIGSIMCFKTQESEWQHVKDSNIWDLEDEGNRMLAVLRLSYEHLPPYMKQCFSFCSIFPKDYIMTKQQLIELWMANGFIPSKGAFDMHEIGCEIFNQLTWRSFFQEVKEDFDGNVTCKMHDLIHDVARSVTGHECCVIEPNEVLKIPKTARHIFVDKGSLSKGKSMEILKVPSLRSFILPYYSNTDIPITSYLIKQSHLKVLDIHQYVKNIALDYLKHLRYLNLSDSDIEALPESTNYLQNLQTLNLRSCHKLQNLPKRMNQLKNLRYLDIKDCFALTSIPGGLENLSCLRKLTMFIVGKDEGRGISQLQKLALEGELSITELYNVKSFAEAKKSNLMEKENLRSLNLSFERVRCHESSGDKNDEEILNGLQPHSSLKKLCISGYQGLRFPCWMMDLLLPNLVEIRIDSFEKCDRLPPLGKLCCLKKLILSGMDALKSIDSSFYGDGESSFLSLEILELSELECLEEWTSVDESESFPYLSSLTISYCPKLVKLPKLESLIGLNIQGYSVTLLKEVMRIASILTSLEIGESSDLTTELPNGLFQNQKHLERLDISLSSLKSLTNVLDNLSSLKELDLHSCIELDSLPAGLQNLTSLERLNLYRCDSLVTLPVNGLEGLSSLSSLRIQHCEKLASVSEGVQYLTSLQDLFINECPELMSLPNNIQHLSSLRSLKIWDCKRLITLPNEIENLSSLSTLEILNCSNLITLPQGISNLTALKTLRIEECPNLERLC